MKFTHIESVPSPDDSPVRGTEVRVNVDVSYEELSALTGCATNQDNAADVISRPVVQEAVRVAYNEHCRRAA